MRSIKLKFTFLILALLAGCGVSIKDLNKVDGLNATDINNNSNIFTYDESSPVYTVNSLISDNTHNLNDTSETIFSVSPSLPTGLSLDTNSGVISGTPNVVVDPAMDYTITATTGSDTESITISITIVNAPPNNLTYSDQTPTYQIGVMITANTPTVSGGNVVTYSVSPALPTGLSLNSTTGIITGTSSVVVDPVSDYIITATNAAGSTNTTLSIHIIDQAPTSLSYASSSPTYTKYNSISNNSPSSSGGSIVSYSISPALPSGLSLNTSTGVISGTPTQSDETGSNYTITGTNSGGSTNTVVNITILIPNFTWLGSGGDSNWSTAANWKGGSAPGTSDTAIFDDECASNCNALIDAAIDIQEVQLKASYSGTITQGSGNTITLGTNYRSNPGGWDQDAGVFLGTDANVRSDFIAVNGGTYTATSAETRVGFNAAYDSFSIGFDLGASATFNHNNGLFYVDSEGNNTPGRRPFMFNLDQPLVLYNFEFDMESQTTLTIGGDTSYNGHDAHISGTSATIQVLNEYHQRNGQFQRGTIEFFGSDARFHCDSPTTPDICSDPQSGINTATGFYALTRFIFKGSSAQTYTFDDGAGAPSFVIDNTNGVTPNVTSTGDLRIGQLHIENGPFTAPSGKLQLGKGLNTTYHGVDATRPGIRVDAGGSFVHNNGEVSIEYTTQYDDGRDGFRFTLDSSTISFYDFTFDIQGDYDGLNPGDSYEAIIPNGYTIVVENDYRHKDGRFSSSWSSNARIEIRGNYYRECASAATSVCAAYDYWVSKAFTGPTTTINIDSDATTYASECGQCQMIFAPGSGNTVTIATDWNLSGTTADFNLNDGTLELSSGVAVGLGDDFYHDSIVTCSGGAYVTVGDAITGSPLGGDNAACYGP